MILCIVLLLLVLGTTASIVMVSNYESKAVFEKTERLIAFQLAEAGLATAKWEIGENTDPNGDGLGNVTVTTTEGTNAVTAVDLGSDTFELTSTSTVGTVTLSLQEFVVQKDASPFPIAAISMVGDLSAMDIQLPSGGVYGPGGSKTLLIDGANTPAILATHADVHAGTGSTFATAVNDGDFDVNNMLGTPDTTFAGVDLPIALQTEENSNLDSLADVYTEMSTELSNTIIPAATEQTLSSDPNIVYGTADSPETYVFNEFTKLEGGQTLTGYGTLVISNKFEIEAGATLNWHGNIIVYGDEQNDSELEVTGNLGVDGNIVLLSQADKDSKLTLIEDSKTAVNGALTLLSSNTDGAHTQTYVDGDLQVNGFLTALGPLNEVVFGETSDVLVTGSLQAGVPATVENGNTLTMRFEGDAAFHKDDAGIETGLSTLQDFGTDLGLAEFLKLLDIEKQITSYGWQALTSNPYYE